MFYSKEPSQALFNEILVVAVVRIAKRIVQEGTFCSNGYKNPDGLLSVVIANEVIAHLTLATY